jgi:hypothetical protein
VSPPWRAAGNFNNVEPHTSSTRRTRSWCRPRAGGHRLPDERPVRELSPTNANATYTACPTGDTKDKRNEGLLLAKTGPTNNSAGATADLKGVKDTTLTELGYDIRKPTSATDRAGRTAAAAHRASTS